MNKKLIESTHSDSIYVVVVILFHSSSNDNQTIFVRKIKHEERKKEKKNNKNERINQDCIVVASHRMGKTGKTLPKQCLPICVL